MLEGEGKKDSTLDSYRAIMRMHLRPHFGAMKLDKIGPRDIEAFKRTRRKLAPKTIRNVLTVLSKVFSTARRLDIIRQSPHIAMPKLPGHVGFDFWDFDEAERFLNHVDSEPLIATWVRLGLATGLRVGELTGLKWGDVDLERRQLVVRRQVHKLSITRPKSNRLRTVPLSLAAVAALTMQKPLTYMRSLAGSDDWVFYDETGFVTSDRTKRGFQRAIRRAGVKRIRHHDLRHTFASHCVMRGVPIEVLKEWLGHSDIRMTMRYAHLAPRHSHRFVELLDEQPHDTPVTPSKDEPLNPA